MNPNVFISSTIEDLKPYREAAKEAIMSAGFYPQMQEYFTAQSKYPPLETCLQKVDECDILVVIVGYRHGWTPKEQPLEPGVYSGTKSITRLECERARAREIEILAFLVDETYEWPVEKKEEGRAATALMNGTFTPELPNEIQRNVQSIKEFKSWLSSLGIRKTFTTPESLKAPVAVSLKEWKERTYQKNPSSHNYRTHDILRAIPQYYKDWIRGECVYLDVEKLLEREKPLHLELPHIYVPLYGNDPSQKMVDMKHKSRTIRKADAEKPEQHRDVKELIAENEYLLIAGHPGSGKTTLLRHLAWQIVHDEGLEQFRGYLPVIIFLRRFAGFKPEDIHSAEQLIERYLADNIAAWDKTLFQHYHQKEKVLILLDGLDEISKELRRRIVEVFGNFRNTSRNKLVLAGRPHGVEGPAFARFGKKQVLIEDLHTDAIKKFIGKWHTYVYSQSQHKATKTAQGMIAEITAKETVRYLIASPLMLTAVCILYNFDRELPDQRAELYLRFVDYLIKKQFSEAVGPYSFIRLLAFRMQEKGLRQCYCGEAIDIFREIYEKKPGENKVVYSTRTEELFKEIEPRCGLLKFEQNQYEFWHWTIQEFLAADYLCRTSPNHAKTITHYWDRENYQEVVKLYIGLLGLTIPGISSGIITSVMNDMDAPLARVRLIAESLVDIEEKQRIKESVQATRKRLWHIIRTDSSRKIKAACGELIGWLGDDRDDLKEFILIEGGEYDLQGLGKREIESFEMGKYPVINAWYREFIDSDGYKKKEYWSGEGWQWVIKEKIKCPELWNDKQWICLNAPVVGVSWYETEAFACWYTMIRNDDYIYRLPGEAEWQAAAAGYENRTYPWGDEWDFTRCNCDEGDDTIGKTSAVGIFERGKTPDGIYDMAGNVWEWCLTKYDNGGFRVVRGGGWRSGTRDCRCDYRSRLWTEDHHFCIGFRLSRGHKESRQDR